MTDASLPDLAAPAIIETLSAETILAELKVRFIELYPGFDAFLESDPAVKLIEVAAYREVLLRGRINDAARANLLAYALGSDLDHLAAFYGVARLAAEPDEAYRLRIRERIIGWSTAGGAAHYRYHALSAHADIEDAAVSSPAPGAVAVAILPRPGADGAAVLQAATARLSDPAIRVLTDSVTVSLAHPVAFTIAARLWLDGATAADQVAAIAAAFPARFVAARRLGQRIARSWLVAELHRPGVTRVELDAPLADLVPPADGYADLGAVSLTLGGFDT